MLENYLLEQLVTFADCGTLSQAAKQLHISKPALSKSMRRLEDLFGIPLFHRSSSHIELNANGQVAVLYAQRALKATQTIIPATVAFYQRQHTLKIAGCSTIALHRLIQRCQEVLPTITLTTTLIPHPHVADLLSTHDYDLVIATKDQQNSDFVCQKLFTEQLTLSVPSASPLAANRTLHFTDLSGQSILAHAGSGIWIDLCRQANPQINLLVQDNMTSLDQLVKASQLPVFSSTQTTIDQHDQTRVKISLEDPADTLTYYLVCQKEKYRELKAIYVSH